MPKCPCSVPNVYFHSYPWEEGVFTTWTFYGQKLKALEESSEEAKLEI